MIIILGAIMKNYESITESKEKSKMFAKQCSLIDNGSTLPSLFPLIIKKWYLDADFLVEDLKSVISKVDSNKAHCDDMIWLFNIICKSCPM